MPAALPIVLGAYLGAGLYHVGQRLGREPSHPDALSWRETRRMAATLVAWAPACLAGTARYARAGWRPALTYFLAEAGGPFGLFAGILLAAFWPR